MAEDAPALQAAERLMAAICLLYAFRAIAAHLTGVDLHVGLVSFAVAGVAALFLVRERPAGFPTMLDLAVLAFASLALVETVALTGVNAKSTKGFTIETRFVVFYLVARFFRLRARFGVWLLDAILWLGIAAAVLGALEYHLAWGTLLELGTQPLTASFHKLGMPRLYSFPMSVLGTAYLFVLALAAACGLTAAGRRLGLVALALFVLWHSLPLTLARAPIVLALAITAAYGFWDRTRGRWFTGLSLAAMAAAALVYWIRGWHGPILDYAAAGTALIDSSSAIHAQAVWEGIELVQEKPLGWGLGEGGYFAIQRGGVFPRYETHYVTLAVQMGLPGLACFLWVVAASGLLWLRTARSIDRDRRAFGFAGGAFWATMTLGGVVAATWSMVVPQLYFWILTGVAANVAAASQAAAAGAGVWASPDGRRRIVFAASSLLFVTSLLATGRFSGWASLMAAADGRCALARAESSGNADEMRGALRELSEAHDLNPLLPRHRLELESAIDLAVARIGPARVDSPARAGLPARVALATALARRGESEALDGLSREIAPAEIERMPDATLTRLGGALANRGRCGEAQPIAEEDRARGFGAGTFDVAQARCWLSGGEPARAVPILEQVTARSPASPWPYVLLSEGRLALGEGSEAAAAAETVTARWPELYDGWYLRGRALLEAGRAEEAAASFERASSLRPESWWPWFFLAESRLAAGDAAGAEVLSRRVVERWPDFYYGWQVHGRILKKLGRLAEAVAAVEKALALRPGSQYVSFLLAESRFEAGDAAGAEPVSRQVVENWPDFYYGWHLHGRILKQVGRHAEAASAFERALALRPGSQGALFFLAESRFEAGDAAGAAPVSRQVVERWPDFYNGWYLHGRILKKLGRPTEAVSALEKALAIRPESHWAAFFLAESRLEAGEVAAAEAMSENIVARRPEFYYGWHLRARSLAKAKRPLEAAYCFERALELRPENTWIRGWIDDLRSGTRRSRGQPVSG